MTAMRRPDLIIFDLDGVLVDSERLSSDALIAELAAAGHRITAEEVRRDFLGRSFPTVAAGLRARIGEGFPADFEERYRARLFAAFERGLAPTPGVTDMLGGLDLPCRVATSSTPVRARKALAATGLLERFEGLVDTASEVAHGKPAPDLFLLSARRAGADPTRCVVVEDSAPGILAAAAAGMASVLYLGGGHHAGRDWTGPEPTLGTIGVWTDLAPLLDLVPA